ncbi:MAG: O-antigen ligase family protein, partial [Solirubrobacteraceae bacterium]|nr:O-antigen ligase family protein [Solirubrobacteraceae bacterium]
MHARVTPGDLPAASIAGLVGCGTVLAMIGAVFVMGPMGLLVPAAVCAVLAAIRWPALAVGACVVPSLMIELALGDGYAPGATFYLTSFGGIGLSEVLVFFAVGVVGLDCVRRRRFPPVPVPVALALGLMAVAILIGTVVGYAGGAGLGEQIRGIRNVVPLIVSIPLVAAVMPEGERMRTVVAGGAALIALKAILGLAQQVQLGGVGLQAIVYFEPTANWVFVLYLLVLAACRLRKVPLPWWVWAAAPFVLLEFVASLKRSLWIGLVVGLLLVFAVGLSRLGRRLVVPGILVCAALIWVLVTAGFGDRLSGPVAQRVESLDPTALSTNRSDRYRLDERANVWAAIQEHPLTGLGQGITWKAVHPLGIEYSKLRDYVHFAPLWFWMKYSVIG